MTSYWPAGSRRKYSPAKPKRRPSVNYRLRLSHFPALQYSLVVTGCLIGLVSVAFLIHTVASCRDQRSTFKNQKLKINDQSHLHGFSGLSVDDESLDAGVDLQNNFRFRDGEPEAQPEIRGCKTDSPHELHERLLVVLPQRGQLCNF